MKYIGLLLLIISLPINAHEQLIEIDISECGDKSCFSIFEETYNLSDDLKIVTWADITDTMDDGSPSFYPLFNIYNYDSHIVNLNIGMQLLDKDKSILIEGKYDTKFTPYDESESQYKIYRSLNAYSLTNDILKNTKFINIVIQK